ncbi:pentapeptide repeat-containing protein [Streptomyces sioyaensis]|uniref:pentapeptide repeat-containing protein n=1 Tax=Streptomyces sioyaensis TaxID=67364 RepID=UPI003787533C
MSTPNPPSSPTNADGAWKKTVEFCTLVAALLAAFLSWRFGDLAAHQASKSEINQRYTNALDKTGSKDPEVRMGAIYILESISQEKGDNDPRQIAEIMTSVVRTYAATSKRKVKAHHKPPPAQTTREQVCWPMPRPKVDVWAAMEVLGRREVVAGQQLDLHDTSLRRLELPEGANFSNGDLRDINLSCARLPKVNLRNADLAGSNMKYADLSGALLEGARLNKSGVSHVDWTGATCPDWHHITKKGDTCIGHLKNTRKYTPPKKKPIPVYPGLPKPLRLPTFL